MDPQQMGLDKDVLMRHESGRLSVFPSFHTQSKNHITISILQSNAYTWPPLMETIFDTRPNNLNSQPWINTRVKTPTLETARTKEPEPFVHSFTMEITRTCRTNQQPFYHARSPLPKAYQRFPGPLKTGLSFKIKGNADNRIRLCLSQRLGVSGCTRRSSGSEAEMSSEGEEEDWIVEMGKLREKCKERKGVVELLECLEREAIMGDDEGREPTDYNRRAQIFEKSSKVFVALKERTATPS